MKQSIFWCIQALLLFIHLPLIYAQTVSGLVTTEEGPLAGATVLIQDTDTYTTTDFDGKFTIEAESSAILVISFVGFNAQKVTVNNQNFLRVALSPSTKLNEVILTALGIRREEKALGYAVQAIKSSELNKVKVTNIANSLAGKIAGVYVTSSSAGPSASSNITIRGASSLTGNNQPLFVVNGMPITNELYSFDDGLNGSSNIDFGNAAQIINPEDINTLTVLKGPAASALYGARAANGVILVETKTGASNKSGLGVEINSSIQFSTPLKLPNYQNEFGYGGGGRYTYLDGTRYGPTYYDGWAENWGPRMNGQLVKKFNSNGVAVPFTPAPNNIRNFYQEAITHSTNIALNNFSKTSQSRFSYTRLDNQGIIPNTNLERNTFYLSFGKNFFNNKLSLQFNSMFVRSTSDNIPNSGYDESSSVMYGWIWYPRDVEINELRDYWSPGQEGIQQRNYESLWSNNPWFVVNENTNAFENNRSISNLDLTFDPAPAFSIRFKYGVDYLNEQRYYRRAPSTRVVLNGSYREDNIAFRESNAELLLNFDPTPNKENRIDINATMGGNLMSQQAHFGVANNPELLNFGTSPSVYTLTNARSGVLVESQKRNAKINSVFGLLTIDYDNWIYLDASYRSDWSSTLVNPLVGAAASNYSYNYPSISSSLLMSEILNFPQFIDFLKLRLSYAEVGSGAPPYSFENTFTPAPAFDGNPLFTLGNTISDPSLKNERTKARELGLDLRLFGDTVNLDATYYQMNSFDQIISQPVAITSGYDYKLTNGGEISNTGFEIAARINWINTQNFGFSNRFNFGSNRAIVEALPDIFSSGRYSIIADVFPGDEGGSDLELVAEQGKLLGQLYGLGFERGPNGEIIHENGVPILTNEKVSAGTYQPDFRLGVFNEFYFKNITLSFLFDGQKGGKLYSRSHALYATSGSIVNDDDPNLPLTTLEGRTLYDVNYDANGDPVYTLDQEGGIIAPGLMYDNNGNLVENNVSVSPGGFGSDGYFYRYYGNGFNRDIIESGTFDASFIKLREFNLGYQFNSDLLDTWSIQTARLSLTGRNLLLFTKVPTIDPETYSIRNGVFVNGFESASIPSQRSMGLILNLTF